MRIFFSGLLFIFILTGCDKSKDDQCAFIPTTDNIDLSLNFESLEDSLPAIESKKDLVNFLSRHAAMRDYFFNRQAYPSDSAFINELFVRFTHPSIDTLLTETHRVFGNGEELKSEFEAAFKNLKYYFII